MQDGILHKILVEKIAFISENDENASHWSSAARQKCELHLMPEVQPTKEKERKRERKRNNQSEWLVLPSPFQSLGVASTTSLGSHLLVAQQDSVRQGS